MFNTSANVNPGPSTSSSSQNSRIPTIDSEDASNFLSVPTEVRQLIFAQLSYEELSKTRLVCRPISREVWLTLNKGFKEFSLQLERERQQLKRELPRRESDRRKHRLFPYSEIIASLETRRDLLEMTYRKYMDKDDICFIPGKVLDEGFRLLRFLRANKGTGIPMTYELLKDFRDLSSMAIDHFDESIAPKLRKKSDAFYTTMMSNLKRHNLGINLSSAKAWLFPPTSSKASGTTKVGTNYLQQRISEQDAIIRKQNEKIDTLRTTMGLLITAVERLSNYVELPVPIAQLREMLTEENSSDNETQEKQCTVNTCQEAADTVQGSRKRKMRDQSYEESTSKKPC